MSDDAIIALAIYICIFAVAAIGIWVQESVYGKGDE